VARRELLTAYASSNAALSRDFLEGKPAFDDPEPEAEADWVSPEARVPMVLAGVIARSLLQSQDKDAEIEPERDVSFLERIKTLLHR
jgi:hypothetical protein